MMNEAQLERFMLLPFSVGCYSESSVDLATTTTTHLPKCKRSKQSGLKGEEEKPSRGKAKKKDGISKSSVSQGLYRLINKLFRSFSQSFFYKNEIDHTEKEIEIGFPTDIKHVTHIGVDGSTKTNNPISTWENSKEYEDKVVFVPKMSLEHFELVMAAQCRGMLPLEMNSSNSNQIDGFMEAIGSP